MNRTYGAMPKDLGTHMIRGSELMMYQDMPLKLSYGTPSYEDRLSQFWGLIDTAKEDFLALRGRSQLNKSYIFLTAKRLFQPKGVPFNTEGYHSDGFMSDDITYVWSDKDQTIVNTSNFILTQDQNISLKDMRAQADPSKDIQFPDNTLIRMDQFVIHKVAEVKEQGVRTFVKIVFSDNRYDLEGNTRNYLLDYNWPMRPRRNNANGRHVPQEILR